VKTAALAALAFLCGCSSILPRDLPEEPPPLADLEEPLELFAEPDDEAERAALPPGGFTGLTLSEAPALLGEDVPPGVEVIEVAANSPADAAGILPGDLLYAVLLPDGAEREVRNASDFRKIEIDAAPGTVLRIGIDRAGVEAAASVTVAARARPPARAAAERYPETRRAGVVVRTATEAEARRAGLGPGGGAVVVGLSKSSPWRAAGLVYGDLIAAADDTPVSHPQVLLDAIREADDEVRLAVFRGGERMELRAPLTTRARETSRVSIPPLWFYESDRGSSELSILLGFFRYRSTEAAWDVRFLWLFSFTRGDADRLIEVDR
jgi:C-terminal processing protease CtpA/Prc